METSTPDENEKLCPYCAETIKDAAIKCRYCSEFLDDDEWDIRVNEMQTVQIGSNPGIAAVMSTLLPGLGQIFHGRIFEGLLIMGAIVLTAFAIAKTFIALFAVLVLYSINIFDAYYGFLCLSQGLPGGVAANLRNEPAPLPQEERL